MFNPQINFPTPSAILTSSFAILKLIKMLSLFWLHQFLGLIFCNFSFQAIASPYTSSSTILCRADQSHALLLFRKSFSITIFASPSYWWDSQYSSYPKTESWREGTDCCLWDGISCDIETGYVIGLDLSYSMLYGSIPSDSTLFSLSHLQYLDLSHNDFNGSQISSRFGYFFNLIELNLNSCNFLGQVPSEVSQLSRLISLDLSSNGIALETSTFTKIVQNLTELKELRLTRVDMSMVAPPSLMNLSSSLSSLELAVSGLGQKFLDYISSSSQLISLNLFGNIDLKIDTPAFVNLVQNLSNLREMDLSSVDLSSLGPSSFLNLPSSLSSLKLYSCGLEGKFPDIYHLSKLVILDLGDNSNLRIDEIVFNKLVQKLPNLREVGLSSINLSSIEPNSLLNLSSALSSLYLGDCGLRGDFPGDLLRRPYIQWLDLRGNKDLNGFLPMSNWSNSLRRLSLSYTKIPILLQADFFDNFKSLELLELASCNFIGSDVALFGNLTKLTYLDISNNDFSGEIPSSFQNLKLLYYLRFDENNFSGPIPKFFKNFAQLQLLDLSDNQLLGQIPSLQSNSYVYIDFSNNKLHGSIPSSIFNNADLRVLRLSSNGKLTGELSSSVCSLKSLAILDLGNNSFSGFIPQCLGNYSNTLSFLNLGGNNFHGIIPPTFSESNSLRYINLGCNELEGVVPPSIINCRNLEVLDLGNNNIVDTFPSFLGILPQLQVLLLHSNKLYGLVKSINMIYSFPKLRIFDLSNNGFSGPLPADFFSHFEAMMNSKYNISYNRLTLFYFSRNRLQNYHCYYSVRMTLKGLETELAKIQNSFTSIDLSCNKFTGKIPQSIGELKALKQLNLSHNYLTGNIQPSLGNLTNLESLDLSSNLLSGRIPVQLVDLTFLQVFSVAQNQLEGLIPQGKQFNTFDNNSYEGNLGLCGFPLKKWSNEETQHQTPLKQDNSESENGFGLKAVLTGYSCGLVIGVAMGYVVFRTRKPTWVVRMVEGKGNQRPKNFERKN